MPSPLAELRVNEKRQAQLSSAILQRIVPLKHCHSHHTLPNHFNIIIDHVLTDWSGGILHNLSPTLHKIDEFIRLGRPQQSTRNHYNIRCHWAKHYHYIIIMIIFNLGNDCNNVDRLERHIIYHYLYNNLVHIYAVFHIRNNFMYVIFSSTIEHQCLPSYFRKK